MKDFLKKLIQAQSTQTTGELEASEVIRKEFLRYGIDAEIDQWDKNRSNCIAHIRSSGSRNALMFVCHHDVVPEGETAWIYPPYDAVEENGRIYGRGSTDMKGGIAAAVTAMGELVQEKIDLKGDLLFAATAGEETDSCGINRFTQDPKGWPQPAGIIIPEPTNFSIVTAHRGLLWLNIETYGKTAHGSAPNLGVNAINSMQVILNSLGDFRFDTPKHPLLGNCSLSINKISGGRAFNVVPDKCSLGIDIRTIPSVPHNSIVRQIQNILDKLTESIPAFTAEIRINRSVEALETNRDDPFVTNFCRAVGIDQLNTLGYTTDGSELTGFNAPILIFGPGDSSLCHQPNEYIDFVQVEKAVAYYKALIRTFLT